MRDVEFPNSGRRVRSADAAVFKAVEHEAARERESQQQEQRRVRSAPQIDQSNIPAFTRNPQSDGRMTSQVRQQPSRQAHLTRGPEPVRLPRAEEQPAPAKAKKAPKAETQNKYTKRRSALRRHFFLSCFLFSYSVSFLQARSSFTWKIRALLFPRILSKQARRQTSICILLANRCSEITYPAILIFRP